MNLTRSPVAALQMILARQLERPFDRLRPRAREHCASLAEAVGRPADQVGGQALGRFVGEEGAMGVSQLRRLSSDRGDRRGMGCPRHETAAPPQASI